MWYGVLHFISDIWAENMRKKWYIIENNSQKVLEFNTKKEMLEWAKRNRWKIKKCPLYDNFYYTECYVVLPLPFKD